MNYVKINTLKGYKEFTTKYPNSNHIHDAKNKAYSKATSINTFAGYKEYLKLFQYHKTNDAKNKVYDLACEANDFNIYKQFLIDFSYHRKREIYQKAFNIVKSKNTIEEYNNYITTFSSSHLISDAKTKRDLIIYNNFISSIKYKSTKEQLIEIDNFVKNNLYFKHHDKLVSYSKKILPTISTEQNFDKKYNDFGKYRYKTSKIKTVVHDYKFW